MNLIKPFAAAVFALVSLSAAAVPFRGTYDVTVNTGDKGLEIGVSPDAGTLKFDLAPGQQTDWISLFRIWTPESSVDKDDTVPLAASIDFQFVLPTTFGGSSQGTTEGASLFYGLWQQGELHWANGGLNSLYFRGGVLDVFLSDTTFGGSFLGLGDSKGTVSAKFSYRTVAMAVPEPGTLLLFGAGLLVVGLVGRRHLRK